MYMYNAIIYFMEVFFFFFWSTHLFLWGVGQLLLQLREGGGRRGGGTYGEAGTAQCSQLTSWTCALCSSFIQSMACLERKVHTNIITLCVYNKYISVIIKSQRTCIS